MGEKELRLMEYYITTGIKDQIPIEIQIFCWKCYEACKLKGKCDYLHVFDLKILNQNIQQIEHRQEVPTYKKIHHMPSNSPISEKIFIIDEGEYIMMMLGNEY